MNNIKLFGHSFEKINIEANGKNWWKFIHRWLYPITPTTWIDIKLYTFAKIYI